ncbi:MULTISPECIES: pseudouridine synthase [unclassified Lactococcus]|uniref:pseudouridine synthase n=1 Tax=unclassified Lactococcus TaxID=2643510 RepID=UPI0011C9FCD8|nr:MULTISPECIES: pseudouridine synthase [unclassified Lactococcus]MQW23065.1 pseudouridine synthase [Lactococcus sp. dk101]TXK44410.1 rRNA pseudouridine synthase [Lactococcus sp. dk310]TXK50220.1 rRNA pseudouridine synthase [Lactococcus sp. dk322]
MRLDKFLAEAGLGSRSEVKVLLKKGKVTVAGLVIKDGRFQVDKNSTEVAFEGEPLIYQEYYYYLLNKPQGVVSATKDNLDSTVVDLLAAEDFRSDIFPVGRLDKNTEGLLILTNDGALGHDLTQPKKHVEKEYFAHIDGEVTAEIVQRFADGLTLKNGEKVKPGEVFVEKTMESQTQSGMMSEIRIIIHEGKFHQVKRMFEAVGMYVLYLKRIRMGNLQLDDDLALGQYRTLTENEIESLKK